MARYSAKSHKLSGLKSWFTKFVSENPAIAYKLVGQDFDAITKGMSTAQVQLMLSMVSCACSVGAETSRQFWAPKYHKMREAAERATGNKEVSYSGLRLVVS